MNVSDDAMLAAQRAVEKALIESQRLLEAYDASLAGATAQLRGIDEEGRDFLAAARAAQAELFAPFTVPPLQTAEQFAAVRVPGGRIHDSSRPKGRMPPTPSAARSGSPTHDTAASKAQPRT